MARGSHAGGVYNDMVTGMASYANAHVLFRINGHFGDVATNAYDHWSTGFRIGTVGADMSAGVDYTAFLNAVAPAIQTFHTSASAQAGTNCWLAELTAARVGVNGRYEPSAQNTIRRAYPTPVAGTGSAINPWNTAMVISLRTDIPRGIASNGRTYWPSTALGVSFSTGRLSTSLTNGYVAAAKTLVNAINVAVAANIGASAYVIVAGQTGKTGPARNARVTGLRVDNRLDSIERRENDLPPIYSTTTIP